MVQRFRGSTLVLATMLAVLGTACGATGGGSVDSGSSPTRPPTTTTAGGEGDGGPGGTTATTSSPAPGPAGTTTDVQLYFTKGEKVVAVTRAIPKVTAIGAETMKALVGGPTAAEDSFSTAIPPETRFRGLTIADGVAKVDLSRDFESGGGSLGLSLRLAQVTCTLDQFESVRGVRFLLDGELVNVFSGNGIILDQPVSCADYDEFTNLLFAGIWPFTSQADMDVYFTGTDRTFTSPVETAKAFGVRYLGMVNPATFGSPTPTAGGRLEVKLGFTTGEGGNPIADPQPSMSVFLLSGGADGDQGPWTVVAATSPQIVVSAPAALDAISSPVAVRGQAATFEGNVEVQVREDGMLADGNLGVGHVTGRGDGILGPFAGEIPFTPPSEPAGAVVFLERSAADGAGVLRATVVRVALP